MKHLAAYCLLELMGAKVSEEAINDVLASVKITPDAQRVKELLDAVKDKKFDDLVENGMAQMCAVSSAPAAAVSTGSAGAAAAEPEKKEEEKKEESESSEEAFGFGGLF